MSEKVRKVTAIVLRGQPSQREVLVFDHPWDDGGVVLQVPAGTIEPTEEPEAAASRELLEESGIEALGQVLVAVRDEEVDGTERRRWVYAFEAPPNLPAEWPYTCDCGAPIRFHWLPLQEASIMAPQQPWIKAVRDFLRSTKI